MLSRICMDEDTPEELYRKPEVKALSIELDEGEDIIAQAKQAMDNHRVNKATIAEAAGKLKQGKLLLVDDQGNESTVEVQGNDVSGASGRLELNEFKNSFEGEVYLIVKLENKVVSAKLLQGTAMQGFKLKLRFLKGD
ncbi:hypothetical protein HZB89_00145 [archaeon]|nr:hypothetical protein [archaeon]